MMRYKLICALIAALTLSPASATDITQQNKTKMMKIKITIANQSITTTMVENSTTRDFLTLLPLILPLTDYANAEKIAHLPRKLATQDAAQGMTPIAGDITYYAPWGNLAIFYRGNNYAEGLIKLGHIEPALVDLSAASAIHIEISQ